MRLRWTVRLALMVAFLLGLPFINFSTAQGAESETEVRIVAQRVADGRTEFALQQRGADGRWGERMLPTRRFFPANVAHGRWLVSAPLTIQALTRPVHDVAEGPRYSSGAQTASGASGSYPLGASSPRMLRPGAGWSARR